MRRSIALHRNNVRGDGGEGVDVAEALDEFDAHALAVESPPKSINGSSTVAAKPAKVRRGPSAASRELLATQEINPLSSGETRLG